MRATLLLILVVVLAACNLPFGLGPPSTRTLEAGATQSLAAARTLEITGTYTEEGTAWSIDLQLVRPDTEHVVLSAQGTKLEAILIGKEAYFHGQEFLVRHLGRMLAPRT